MRGGRVGDYSVLSLRHVFYTEKSEMNEKEVVGWIIGMNEKKAIGIENRETE